MGVWTATRQTWGATRHAQRQLRELGRDAKRKAQHVAQAVQSPDWRQVAGNILALPGLNQLKARAGEGEKDTEKETRKGQHETLNVRDESVT